MCQVGSTRLGYHARAIDDLHACLKEQGDSVPLGTADENKEVVPRTVEALGLAELEHNPRNNGMRAI